MPHFGRRILGNAAFDAEAKKEAVGGHHFGPRITGQHAAVQAAPGHFAKPVANQKGERLTNADGSPPSTSVEELRSILNANAAYFDSLYDAELARAGGARKAALEFFLSFENSDKGQRRPNIGVEIHTFLGKIPVAQAGATARALSKLAAKPVPAAPTAPVTPPPAAPETPNAEGEPK